MELRPSVRGLAFDEMAFARLCQRLAREGSDPHRNRLHAPPLALASPPVAVASLPADERAALADLGTQALRDGRVAAVVLAGGMAMRFGGVAKGCVPVFGTQARHSFLGLKLADLARFPGVPAVVQTSFATRDAVTGHLAEIAWAGVRPEDRFRLEQGIMPRVSREGRPLEARPGASDLEDAEIYAAPGHGETVARLRDSGLWDELAARGVEHLLVSNVDNLGATLDPVLLGLHLQAVARDPRGVTVEVVEREAGDQGGCIARLPEPPHETVILEGFRLPEGTDPAAFPHFNTNTLWISGSALLEAAPLTFFEVYRELPAHPERGRGPVPIVQFEQLIGQLTERVNSTFVTVPRHERFLPVKTRTDLEQLAGRFETLARDLGL